MCTDTHRATIIDCHHDCYSHTETLKVDLNTHHGNKLTTPDEIRFFLISCRAITENKFHLLIYTVPHRILEDKILYLISSPDLYEEIYATFKIETQDVIVLSD